MKTNEIKQATDILLAVSEAICEAGAVPSGHLYAMLANRVDQAGYESMLNILKRADLIEERGHVLRWIGPTVQKLAAERGIA